MQKFFTILIMCSLALPVFSEEIQNEYKDEAQNQNNLEIVTEQEPIVEDSKSILSEDTFQSDVKPYKEPVSKKKLAKKFIIAMFCVAGTSLFLFAVLSIYNKIKEVFSLQQTDDKEDNTTLDTPADITEAVKSFVEKTRW